MQLGREQTSDDVKRGGPIRLYRATTNEYSVLAKDGRPTPNTANVRRAEGVWLTQPKGAFGTVSRSRARSMRSLRLRATISVARADRRSGSLTSGQVRC